MVYRVHLAWAGFELTTWVVICTDCKGSWKSNYHWSSFTWYMQTVGHSTLICMYRLAIDISTCCKHLHHHVISHFTKRVCVGPWDHTYLSHAAWIVVTLPRQWSNRPCVLRVSIVVLFLFIFLINITIVLTVWYIFPLYFIVLIFISH